MTYLIIKALHIIFMVSYFAGLFYLVRIFVYYKDTDEFESPKKEILREQYVFMARRLWNIITVPACVLMTIFGLIMIFINPILLKMPWFHLKLTFLVGLAIYHYWCWRTLKQIQNKVFKYTFVQLRMMNELATILLFSIVFAVIQKAMFGEYWYWSIISFFGSGVILMLIVRLINRNNKK